MEDELKSTVSLFKKNVDSEYFSFDNGCDIQTNISFNLGFYNKVIEQSLKIALSDRIVQRLWDHDFTIWKKNPSELINRLGWLDIANRMLDKLPELEKMADSVRQQGFKKVILLGMGGSSLAPEVLRKTFGFRKGYLDLKISDSTDPGVILSLEREIDINETLFIVSTKSGTTPETLSFFKYFYNLTVRKVGATCAGEHFIAITDPGSKLVEIGRKFNFREIYENDPNIGGRYSALSYFGLVPAALLGIDLDKLIKRAVELEGKSKTGKNVDGLLLGIILGELAKIGKDKLTFLFPEEISCFGDWLEQLIAESTGKEGKGILPIVGETIGKEDEYGDDRVFVHFQLGPSEADKETLRSIIGFGHPVIKLHLDDIYDMGKLMFLSELATAVAGHCLGINPFDQPNVESSKVLTRRLLKDYQEFGRLSQPEPDFINEGITIFGDIKGDSLEEVLYSTFDKVNQGSYVAIQAYLKSSIETENYLKALRIAIRKKTHLATTLGYGPRFLHSTGQLHKGDSGNGLFIQLSASMPEDIIIPDVAGFPEGSITFGTLINAQILGDYKALNEAKRSVIRIDLGSNWENNLKKFVSMVLTD